MNPLTQIKNTQKATAAEIRLGLSDSASWHDKFKHSAYVFVGGLDYELTEGDLLAIFAQYGEIVDVNLVRDKTTGKARGFAFLAYEDQRSTVLAVDNLSGAKVVGRTIRVEHVDNYKRKKAEMEGLDPDAVEAEEAQQQAAQGAGAAAAAAAAAGAQLADFVDESALRGPGGGSGGDGGPGGGSSMADLLAEGRLLRQQRDAARAAASGHAGDKPPKKAKKEKKDKKEKKEKKDKKRKHREQASGSSSSDEDDRYNRNGRLAHGSPADRQRQLEADDRARPSYHSDRSGRHEEDGGGGGREAGRHQDRAMGKGEARVVRGYAYGGERDGSRRDGEGRGRDVDDRDRDWGAGVPGREGRDRDMVHGERSYAGHDREGHGSKHRDSERYDRQRDDAKRSHR